MNNISGSAKLGSSSMCTVGLRGNIAYTVAALLVVVGAVAAEQTTGSRVGSDAVRGAVAQLNEPTEIAMIGRLIEEGRHQEAVDLAREYVASLRGKIPADESIPGEQRYYALNALCNALISAGDIDAAIDTCTTAVELSPSRWVALNSRATAYFASRRFLEALEDYRRALGVAPREPRVIDTIEHNIRLSEERLDAEDR